MDVDIAAHDARIARLEQQLNSGTTVASFEGGNFGYQMVDATYKARCRFLIPTRTVRINKALLHFSLQPFRSGAASGTGGGTSGGESAPHTHHLSFNSSNESGVHNHGIPSLSTPNHQHIAVKLGGFVGAIGTSGVDLQDSSGGSMGALPQTVTRTGVTLNTDSSGGGGTGGGASGTESSFHVHAATGDTGNDSWGHTHTIPGSALSIPNSLYETGMAQGCRVYIDGVDVTPTLGGPWGTGAALDVHDLDVSQWLSAKGWHEVQISSTSIGGIFPSLAIFAVVGV